MINKIKKIITLGLIFSSFFVAFQGVFVSNYGSNYVFAKEVINDGDGRVIDEEGRLIAPKGNNGKSSESNESSSKAKTPETKTAILPSSWKIEDILNMILVVVTTGVGIAAVGSIVFAGILYITARDNAGQVSKAKTMIMNTVIGIIAYILMWAFLEWIIPGGVI